MNELDTPQVNDLQNDDICTETDKPEPAGVTKADKLPQIMATVAANMIVFSAGTLLTWSSPAAPMLQRHDSPFAITNQEVAWVGSLLSLGAAFGGPPFGLMVNKVGRKAAILALSLPVTFSWILIICTRSVTWLYVARFVSGLTLGGVSFVIPIYVAEIVEPSIRGPLSAIFQVGFNIGILYAYAVGAAGNYVFLNLACLAVPIVFVLLFVWMPEAPQYLLSKDKSAGATKSLQWLRGKAHNVDQELHELQQLKEHAEADANNRGSFKDVLMSPEAVKAFVISTGLVGFQQLGGITVVLFYTETIFQAVGSTMSASLSSTIVGIVMLTMSFCIMPIMDRAGRRVLLLVSCAVDMVSLLALGTYFLLKEQLQQDVGAISWLPLMCLIVYIGAYCLGIGPLPWIVMSEVLPPNVKGSVGAIVTSFCWITSFILANSFQTLIDYTGRYCVFWFFALNSGLATSFIYYKVPETKGISLQEIQERLAGKGRENAKGEESV